MTPTVVVASRQSAAELARALAAITPQVDRWGGELVVARDPAAGPIDAVTAAYPAVRVVIGPAGATIPVLRGVGLARAGGDLVALTEDHLYPAPDWLDTLIGALDRGADVVGGGMANAARGRLVDWAAYFSDYGFYSVGRRERPGPPLLTAANAIYPRRFVAEAADWCLAGAWENVVHDRLAARGATLGFEPRARMYHDHHYRLGGFLGNRFSHGRDYARARRLEHRGTAGWARAVSAPALVPLLFARIARAAWREAPAPFFLAAPLTLSLLAGWALGEAAGYLAGGPAPSAEPGSAVPVPTEADAVDTVPASLTHETRP